MFRSPMLLLSRSVTHVSAYLFGNGSVLLTQQRSVRMAPLHESRLNVFMFIWGKSPIQASNVAFSLDKAFMKVYSFFKAGFFRGA